MDYKLVAVLIYVLGMALFTIIMGNAFVAFPDHNGWCGYSNLNQSFWRKPSNGCGNWYAVRLLWNSDDPMAANFNIIPAALLELQDRNLVIKTQIPSGIGILLANLILLYILI